MADIGQGSMKNRIIASYLLLFVLTLSALVYVFGRLNSIAEEQGRPANRKLLLTGNTLTDLYEAEAIGRVYIQTGSDDSFRRYLDLTAQVEAGIDSLRLLTDDSLQSRQIDSIFLLLQEKGEKLRRLAELKKEQEEANLTSSLSGVRQKDSRKTARKTVVSQDTVYVKNEKKRRGLLGFLTGPRKDSTMHVTVSREIEEQINKRKEFD